MHPEQFSRRWLASEWKLWLPDSTGKDVRFRDRDRGECWCRCESCQWLRRERFAPLSQVFEVRRIPIAEPEPAARSSLQRRWLCALGQNAFRAPISEGDRRFSLARFY